MSYTKRPKIRFVSDNYRYIKRPPMVSARAHRLHAGRGRRRGVVDACPGREQPSLARRDRVGLRVGAARCQRARVDRLQDVGDPIYSGTDIDSMKLTVTLRRLGLLIPLN